MQVLRFRLFSLFVITLILWSIGSSLGRTQEQEQALGELMLEGKHIERLVLQRKDGHIERFNRPGEILQLPLGQYQLLESHLDGGYVCLQGAGQQNSWITITENKPMELKVGAPLKQTLKVKRRGKALVFDYKLLGIGDESYTKNDRNKPPRLIVYNGDEEINSGRFEYG